MTEGLPMLPTSVVGSHGLPGWVWLAREAMEAGRLGATDVRELMEDATQVALLDQERAGIDVVSTGEMMRVRFIIGFYDRLTGIHALPAPRTLGQPLWDTNTPFEVREKIAAPSGLGIVEEFTLARSLTGKRIKATVPGPYTLLVPLKLGGGYTDKSSLLADLVGIVNAECRALVAAGADFIQIDEPHHGMYSGSVHEVNRGINKAVEGVTAKIAVHVCFGNLYGRPFSSVRDYRNVFPTLGEINASQIVLEFANRGMDPAERWKDFPRDKELGAGVVDVKAFKAESADDVAERIRALLKHVAPDKLWLNPDCGFWETPRWVAQRKLRALVDAARAVRTELAG
ncbi:MAG TPA: cobalamin-independent methionine synthase II family protein [Candidatus Limnocylindria bacterium]|nr:cobalamin-independent methionine synthase II family protein [Candidatus Limnocylindria bacterium]